MVKVQDTMSMDEKTVQKLAEGEVKVPRPRRSRTEREHPVDTAVQMRRKSNRIADKLFRGVHEGVYEKAMELAEKNWRRLEVVDQETIIVHNNEVH